MKIPFGLVAFAISIAVAACTGGGGSTGTTGGGSSSGTSQEPAGSAGQEDAYCDAVKSHQTCNGGTASEQPCEDDGKCIYGRLMSRTAANAYFACYSAPSCKSDDTCAGEAGLAAGGDAANAYFDDCRAKLGECPDTFKDDLCSPALFAFPNLRDAAQACLSRPCGELDDCFARALQPIDDCK